MLSDLGLLYRGAAQDKAVKIPTGFKVTLSPSFQGSSPASLAIREAYEKAKKDPTKAEEMGMIAGSSVVAFLKFEMSGIDSYTGTITKDGRLSYFGFMNRRVGDKIKDMIASGRFEGKDSSDQLASALGLMLDLGYAALVQTYGGLERANFKIGEIGMTSLRLTVSKEGKVRKVTPSDISEYDLLKKIKDNFCP